MTKSNVEFRKTILQPRQGIIMTLFGHANIQLRIIRILLLIKAEDDAICAYVVNTSTDITEYIKQPFTRVSFAR